VGEDVLVAWDGGREALRAIAEALPFLDRARQATVIAIDSENDDHAVDNQPAPRLRISAWRRG